MSYDPDLVRRARQKAGLKQREAAAAFDMSLRTYQRWEEPVRPGQKSQRPDADQLAALALLYQVDVNAFYTRVFSGDPPIQTRP